jgi:predicted transcriptional regulator
MESASVKEEARRLVERLPDDASWDDLMHEIYVRQAVEAGLEDSRAGKVSSLEDVRAKVGLSQP